MEAPCLFSFLLFRSFVPVAAAIEDEKKTSTLIQFRSFYIHYGQIGFEEREEGEGERGAEGVIARFPIFGQ